MKTETLIAVPQNLLTEHKKYSINADKFFSWAKDLFTNLSSEASITSYRVGDYLDEKFICQITNKDRDRGLNIWFHTKESAEVKIHIEPLFKREVPSPKLVGIGEFKAEEQARIFEHVHPKIDVIFDTKKHVRITDSPSTIFTEERISWFEQYLNKTNT